MTDDRHVRDQPLNSLDVPIILVNRILHFVSSADKADSPRFVTQSSVYLTAVVLGFDDQEATWRLGNVINLRRVPVFAIQDDVMQRRVI